METLKGDILLHLALELDLPSLINFCETNKETMKTVCNNQKFWMNKLNKDYGIYGLPQGTDYKKKWIKTYNQRKKRKIYRYFVLKSSCDPENTPPKFWDFIKRAKRPYASKNNLLEEDITEQYKIKLLDYPDYGDRCGEIFKFSYGYLPKGTTIYLAYTTFDGERAADINKKRITDWLLSGDELEGKDLSQMINSLENDGYFRINIDGKVYYYILKKFVL